MKLSSLFARYLYQHKQLNLPGIGVFTVDSSAPLLDNADRPPAGAAQHVRYVQTHVAAPDPAFIDFIRTETGKIKPLAESDLDSFLSDGRILLNIGKPFQLEGIGYLQKNKAGQYEFTPGEPVHGKRDGLHTEITDDAMTASVFNDDSSKGTGTKKLLIALGIIGGLALVIWGGYSLYNRNSADKPAIVDNKPAPQPTDEKANAILDSAKKIISSTLNQSSADTYRFIIERTPNKARALRRYAKIKDNLTDIKLQTATDSSLFTLYFELPATPADTARIRDSLKIWYGRKQVLVEP